jgi:WD40 repeat protein
MRWIVSLGLLVAAPLSAQEPKLRTTIKGESAFLCLALSPDGKTLVSTNLDNSIELWDIATDKKIAW